MPATLTLPRADGTLALYTLSGRAPVTAPPGPIRSRIGMAAVHVVADPLAAVNPTLEVALDWDATLRFRHHVWSLGLAVAEAMDTAQRGMGFDWSAARELIKRSVAESKTVPGAVLASGAGTDHLEPGPRVTIADVEAAYEEQCAWIEGCGGRIILMASRALAACAKSPDDYVKVYGRILSQAREPVIVHWLGEMFDPALAGYWGSRGRDRQVETLLAIVNEYATRIDGVKISLLDQAREIAMRRRFPKGVRMYTGDDFDYPTTIGGDAQGYSDALLGIFDVIAPAAAAALHALDRGDRPAFDRILAPTLTLSRHLFGAPTRFYKTGVVFAAYLNGHQSHFRMVGGLESARSIVHLSAQFRLMDAAGLLRDPELAATRMGRVLAVAGVE
ncbi:MAG TPA: dihydrodipicolinate synthase family protein [Methylomirabilota bacterium]